VISRRQFLRGKFSAGRSTGNLAAQSTGIPGKAAIGTACVAYNNVVCRSCGDACGDAAIRFSPRVMGAALPEVIAERCTGCGECVSVCPASAISVNPAA
jgi:ferredoxin-type protein NapF